MVNRLIYKYDTFMTMRPAESRSRVMIDGEALVWPWVKGIRGFGSHWSASLLIRSSIAPKAAIHVPGRIIHFDPSRVIQYPTVLLIHHQG
jgi:hypothetical protein